MSELVTLYQPCDHSHETTDWRECEETRTFEVPANRLVDYHKVRIDENRYHLTHPITCAEFPDCEYELTGQGWNERPVPVGTYRWLGKAGDMKLAREEED